MDHSSSVRLPSTKCSMSPNIPYSRHCSLDGGRADLRLISMLDQEQLCRLPSAEDWWGRRKEQITEETINSPHMARHAHANLALKCMVPLPDCALLVWCR